MSCVTCSRVFVFIMNLLMLLVSLTVIALAVWIWCDNSFESSIRQNIKMTTDREPLSDLKYDMRTGITVSFWVIIGFASACAIVGFAGLLGACVRSKAVLVMYFVIMVIIILLEVAVGIFVLVYRKNVRSTVKDYVAYSYQLNSQNDISTFIDRYDCCGVENQVTLGCAQGLPTCSSAVWDRLDFTMMVFGCSMIGVVVLQIITSLVTIPIFAHSKHEDGP